MYRYSLGMYEKALPDGMPLEEKMKIAKESGIRLVTGPVEAAVCGSVLMQMKGLGRLDSLKEGRDMIAASFPMAVYEP